MRAFAVLRNSLRVNQIHPRHFSTLNNTLRITSVKNTYFFIIIQGLIYKSTGSWYQVTDTTGKRWKARIKGVLKIDDITSTNPIAVGDVVDMEEENALEDTATITRIHDRKNYISRQSPGNRKQHHIVSSNLDQSVLICTLKDPRTSQGFIDRFAIASEAYHVPVVLVFNKKDTWRQKEEQHFVYWKEMYERIGYAVHAISAMQNDGLAAIKALLQNKTTLLSGHSGVGKSSVLNALVPQLLLRTGEVSGWSGKGMHTTTFAEMFDLDFGGRVIDTPGVREFGLVDIEREELSHYFPEMRRLMNDCQFNNCMHINEPGCAVKAAVENLPETADKVYADRYISYVNILESIAKQDWS